MIINSPRQRAIKDAMRILVPDAPFSDFNAIFEHAKSPHMRELSPVDAVWLAAISHIRHRHTDYDKLRDNDYDVASARHFVLDEINDVLFDWGSDRLLEQAGE